MRGRGSDPLPRVHGDHVERHASSRRPAVQPGDRALLYAAVWQAIYGVALVTGPPEQDSSRTRWSWRFPLEPVALIDDLDLAPAVEEAGVLPQSIYRHSHIRLTDEQFEAGRALIESRIARRGA